MQPLDTGISREESGYKVTGYRGRKNTNNMVLCNMQLSVNDLARKYPAFSEYITQIYLILRDYSYCNNRRLADHIGVSPSAVSQAVLRLKKIGLADQDKYGMIMLSEEGERLARELLRRHYLLEYLMVKNLQFPWELADNEAGNLQDKVSPDFIDHLESFLGFPATCPHGNPLPENPEADKILAAPGLDSAPVGSTVRIVRISEEGERVSGLLHACSEAAIVPGKQFSIIASGEKELELVDQDKKTLRFSRVFAGYVRAYIL